MSLKARIELEQAEVKYLESNGWHFIDHDGGLNWCKPEDTKLTKPMPLDKAIAEQKFRDLFKKK